MRSHYSPECRSSRLSRASMQHPVQAGTHAATNRSIRLLTGTGHRKTSISRELNSACKIQLYIPYCINDVMSHLIFLCLHRYRARFVRSLATSRAKWSSRWRRRRRPRWSSWERADWEKYVALSWAASVTMSSTTPTARSWSADNSRRRCRTLL